MGLVSEKNLRNWFLSFGTRDMIFKATMMQLASLSGNFKMNCMSCLSNELSSLTPRVRLRQRSRVRDVTHTFYQNHHKKKV